LPFCYKTLTAKKPSEKPYPKELKTIGDHIRKRRLDLGLFQKDVAATIGVDICTVTNWENGRCGPALRVMPRILEFLGYEPSAFEPSMLGKAIKQYRRMRGISQKELARRLDIDPSTLAKYEAGRNTRRTHLGDMLWDLV
jgi:transcriptional regulator with XRE-family HTH domain